MKWFKVETNDILLGGYTNNHIAILIKYKALYAQLECEPNDRQLATFFTKKEISELKKLQSCNEVVQESIKSELKVKQNHREVDLKNKQKNNELVKNSTSNLLPRIDKKREDKKREEENREECGKPPKKRYAFEGKIIKLTQEDFDRWKNAYPQLNLYAELLQRDSWLSEQPPNEQKRWYMSTPQFFIKQNERRKQQNQANDNGEQLWEDYL